ncbi:MAG: hypothetical protein AAB434_04910 [Planctomycetota bacterium]
MGRSEPGDWDEEEDFDEEDGEEELQEEEFPDGRWVEEGHGRYSEMDVHGLDDCPVCGAEMHTDAASCPRCGNYVVAGGARRKPTWMLVATVLALFAALGWAGLRWLL